jgi:hypothetical protein
MKTKTTRRRRRSRREQNRVYKALKHKGKEQGIVLTGKPRPALCRAKEDDKPYKPPRSKGSSYYIPYRAGPRPKKSKYAISRFHQNFLVTDVI